MYKGRFAPSPTGPLHFGSLIAALASYLEARKQSGEWHVRIDDIDHLRCKSEYTKKILSTLEYLGFEWDGQIVYQSERLANYQDAIAKLKEKNKTYLCTCSRKQLPVGPYPGICRNKQVAANERHSVRLIVPSGKIVFHDYLQGDVVQNLGKEVGDFIILRGDGIVAYHLATVMDDALHGFTDIVRGLDLIDSTPRQIYLQQLLGYSTPNYYHLPVAVNNAGDKLSKQSFAKAIKKEDASSLLIKALAFLNQNPDVTLTAATTNDIFVWAIEHWDIKKTPSEQKIMVDE